MLESKNYLLATCETFCNLLEPFVLFSHRMDSGRGKPVAPVIIDGRKGAAEEDDDDDTFIVEEDPALQNILEMVRI